MSGPAPGSDGRSDTDAATTAARSAKVARVLLCEVREELVKADNKAGLMLATLGAALAALVGAIGGGVVTPRQYAVLPQLLLWTGCAACVPALALLSLAVAPRLGSPRRARAHYFGDARLARSPAHLERTVRGTDLITRDLDQLAVLSRIAWIKYRCIRHALAWSTAFCSLTLLGIVTGATT
ncbi:MULTISPECIES: Pycsar system effector family protein [unclassified Streptomyces]|uniref:Pycsar system effector family protein n=1 Tax=unclassified Streptomyces TaxID=2593676 RepID=UPI003808D49C